jgi:hypothetical protein
LKTIPPSGASRCAIARWKRVIGFGGNASLTNSRFIIEKAVFVKP